VSSSNTGVRTAKDPMKCPNGLLPNYAMDFGVWNGIWTTWKPHLQLPKDKDFETTKRYLLDSILSLRLDKRFK